MAHLMLVAALIARTLDMVSMPGHASAIMACVAALACTEQLSSLDACMHAKYANHLLADILPVNDIPMDIYHCIYLKDVNQTIVTCLYNCPWKYQDAWCTLLSQYLAAGHICPSLSTFASLSFIVPKADPMVLPCWVNDY